MNNLRSVLIDLKLRALEAYKSRNIEFYRYYLADDSLTVTTFTVVDKETALSGIAMTSSQVLGYSMESPRLIFLTTGSTILFYKLTLEIQKDGRRLILPVFVSTAYAHIGGDWHAAFHQHTSFKFSALGFIGDKKNSRID